MSTFGDDLIQSLREALAHAKGDGPAVVHAWTATAPRNAAPGSGGSASAPKDASRSRSSRTIRSRSGSR